MSRNGTTYREVQFTIHYRKEGWLSEIIDAGFREIGYSGARQQIKNAGDDEFPSAPVPLDGNGLALEDPSPLNNVKLTFRGYRRLPFSALPLT